MDEEMMAMMGIAGFGKQKKQKQLDPNRFDKSKRAEVRFFVRCMYNVRSIDATCFLYYRICLPRLPLRR